LISIDAIIFISIFRDTAMPYLRRATFSRRRRRCRHYAVFHYATFAVFASAVDTLPILMPRRAVDAHAAAAAAADAFAATPLFSLTLALPPAAIAVFATLLLTPLRHAAAR
jgi:hypothetical protein